MEDETSTRQRVELRTVQVCVCVLLCWSESGEWRMSIRD